MGASSVEPISLFVSLQIASEMAQKSNLFFIPIVAPPTTIQRISKICGYSHFCWCDDIFMDNKQLTAMWYECRQVAFSRNLGRKKTSSRLKWPLYWLPVIVSHFVCQKLPFALYSVTRKSIYAINIGRTAPENWIWWSNFRCSSKTA